MERYWDCSLCRIEEKGTARRCRTCCGKLKGRDRLLWEVAEASRYRKRASLLSSLTAGVGQMYLRRWGTGIAFGVMIPLAAGLVLFTWRGFSYGHLFVVAAALFVMAVAALDGLVGPTVKRAPCQRTCPAAVGVPDYLQLIVDGDYAQGYSFLRTQVPLVGVIGRICPHPCERRCTRGIDGEPISINGCKRFLADTHRQSTREEEQIEAGAPGSTAPPGPRVAVVGAGPAGIACAYYLAVLGASVTVYEADSLLGGRLGTAIPDHRLPPAILREEVESVRSRGVTFVLQTVVGPGGKLIADVLKEHRAVFFGVGARTALGLRIQGHEWFLDFQDVLRRAKLGPPLELGERVAVIGGGNAAVDVCRTALRLGAKEVHLCYRRTRDEMPARDDEVEEAVREGVHFHYLTDPVAATVDEGGRRSLLLRKMQLGPADSSGRPAPVPVPDSEWSLDVDSVIPALGQTVGGAFFDDPSLQGLRRDTDGRVWCEPNTQRTNIARVYAGGDAVTGPATAVGAMAQGRRAALAICGDWLPELLHGGLRLTDRRIRKAFGGHRETPEAKIREAMPRLSPGLRVSPGREVELGYGEVSARGEARRCLQCHREL